MIKAVKGSHCSLPVKKYIAESMATAIAEIPNYNLRSGIQETMVK